MSGKYKPCEQFPSVRQLAYEASVNPNTMQKALTYLESERLLISRGTVGRFVTDDGEVLRNAAECAKRETVERLVDEARMLGITKEELISYITKEEKGV